MSHSAESAAKSHSDEYKGSKTRTKKKALLTENSVKTIALSKHKKLKEQKKKKLKKRTETRRKQSLGQLLMKTDSSDKMSRLKQSSSQKLS